MSRTTNPAATWFDPRIELGTSPLDGKGLFATDVIQAGEIVMIWGGIVFTSEDWRLSELQQRYCGHFMPFIEHWIQQ